MQILKLILVSLLFSSVVYPRCPQVFVSDWEQSLTFDEIIDDSTIFDLHVEGKNAAGAIEFITGIKPDFRIQDFSNYNYSPVLEFRFNTQNWSFAMSIYGSTDAYITYQTKARSNLIGYQSGGKQFCEVVVEEYPFFVAVIPTAKFKSLSECLDQRMEAMNTIKSSTNHPFLAICKQSNDKNGFAIVVHYLTENATFKKQIESK